MSSSKLRFDGWVLDPQSGDLEREGARTRLQEQPARALQELIANAGNVVTREQLIAVLWPKGVVDFDASLNTAIRKLRSALGDLADTPRYIETLPRRGYRFIGTLDVAPEAIDPAETEKSDLPLPAPQRWRLPWRILLASVAGVGGLTLLLMRYSSHGVDLIRPRSAAVTNPSAALVHAPAAFTPPAHSIAVLPFVNLSSDKEQEYFADGLAEELLDLLAKTPGLHVIARTSSFSFKGKSDDIPTIAAKLNVANILEGSVRKSGHRLRVTAQLIRTDTSEHLWSDTFERDLNDVFKVQDEIANAVAAALKNHVLPVQAQSRRSELRTSNLEAYELYLQGKESYNQGDVAGYQRAVTALRSATALDSQYAAAYAALALAEFWAEDAKASPNGAGYERALAAAEKAIALAPEDAGGYSARGFLRALLQFDFDGARSDLGRAIALNAGDANVLHRSAVVLAMLGDLPAAIEREQRALVLDPLSAEICMRLGFFYVAADRLPEARPLYQKALALAPNSIRAQSHLGNLELFGNRPESALAAFRQTKDEPFSLSGQAKSEYSLGHAEASQRLLQELISKYANVSSYTIAEVYSWRGEIDKAFEWLERADTAREPGLTWLKVDPFFRNLRDDVRYRNLLRKMNLPQ